MQLSLKALGVRKDVVTCIPLSEASAALRQLDLTGDALFVWIVPSRLADHLSVNAKFSEEIRGAKIFVS
jgi:hypothetical protein